MIDHKVIKLNSIPGDHDLPRWDLVIIGAGPAGLAAGLTAAHRGLTTLVIEAKDEKRLHDLKLSLLREKLGRIALARSPMNRSAPMERSSTAEECGN